MSVVGIDACKRGWIAIELRDEATGHFVDKLENLSAHVPNVETVAIDIPIGLPAQGRRQADVAARELLGPRRSSVFFTPVREALLAPTHAEASATRRSSRVTGISQQLYALAQDPGGRAMGGFVLDACLGGPPGGDRRGSRRRRQSVTSRD